MGDDVTSNEPLKLSLATEAGIAAAATMLIGKEVSTEEKRDASEIEALRDQILAGGDPLGDAICTVRSAQARRKTGQTLTPQNMIDFMIRSAVGKGNFRAVVDPGVGSGRFLRRAAEAFPEARLVGVDTDPLSILVSRATFAVLGLLDRSTFILGDYRNAELSTGPGKTLYIGNPPFVRHHDIDAAWKDWYADAAAAMGAKRASKLAGLHLHFFVRTGQLMRPGDVGMFVTAAEWMDATYGEALRTLLRGPMGGTAITNIAADSEPFPGTLATAVITSFAPGSDITDISFGYARSADELDKATRIVHAIRSSKLLERKWSRLGRAEKTRDVPGGVRLGDLFKVSRGQVTGCNKVFIAGPGTPPLPKRFLVPCVTGAEDLFTAADRCGYRLDHRADLKKVVALPEDITGLDDLELGQVAAFIAWAREKGADLSYTARSRKAWWSVPLHDAPSIVATYMARRAPAFVRNVVGAKLLNIAHGVRPKSPMSGIELDAFVSSMNEAAQRSSGRVYAGGLIKYEPSDIADMIIGGPLTDSATGPSLTHSELLHEAA
jgi:hypothetical protein